MGKMPFNGLKKFNTCDLSVNLTLDISSKGRVNHKTNTPLTIGDQVVCTTYLIT